MADEFALESSDDYCSSDEDDKASKKKMKDIKMLKDTLSPFEEEMQSKLDERMASLQESEGLSEPQPRYSSKNTEDSGGLNESEPQGASSYECDGENLYDPEEDDLNTAWIQKKRQRYQVAGVTKPPNSDAILDCPACFTTLCFDCQRHDTYQNQYRAMFTSHCVVDMSQTLKYPSKDTRKPGKSKAQQPADEEEYHPVRCEECNTQVAVFDKDEVYHFFNVLASH